MIYKLQVSCGPNEDNMSEPTEPIVVKTHTFDESSVNPEEIDKVAEFLGEQIGDILRDILL